MKDLFDTIKKILKQDGFKNVELINNEVISFTDHTDFRTFELRGSTVKDLTLILNLDNILKIFYEKTRFSENLKQYIDETDDNNLEEFMESMEWELINIYSPLNNPKWTHDVDSELFYIIKINGLNHIVVNNRVFVGEIDPIEVLGTTSVHQILKDKKIYEFLTQE